MTYCVGMMLERGLVLMSDTRTNSGVDNFSTFRKMFHWSVPGERIIAVMAAGNLATTQTVISRLEERNKAPSNRHNSLLDADTMFHAATIVGRTLKETIALHMRDNSDAHPDTFGASLIVAGQIRGMEPRLFLVYPEGNFIEASFDTPYFQTGETKYGRPILIRGYDPKMSFENAVKLLTVSFDSTLKANLSVGFPLDLLVIERGRFEPRHERRIEAQDSYFRAVSAGWGDALRQTLDALPEYPMDHPARRRS